MAKKKTNRFNAKAKKSKVMAGIAQPLDTKGKPLNSLIETGKDLVIGVVGGGFVGAAIGKPSLLIGIVATGVGHYIDNRLLASLGMGMMASNGFQTKSVNGVEGMDGLEGAKERLEAYKNTFLEKTYFDKLKALQKGKTKATNAIGDVQYFTYPQNMLEGATDDYAMLNHIENQIANTGLQYSNMNGLEEVGSMEETIY